MTIGLIAACCAVFLWQNSLDAAAAGRTVDALGAIPAVIVGAAAGLPADLQWAPRWRGSAVVVEFSAGREGKTIGDAE